MDNENVIARENCSLVISGIGRRAYINSTTGRAELLADCTKHDALDVYDEVMALWGEKPIVPDEPLPPEPTFEELKTQKKAEIAAARYTREIAGTTVNGVTIDTGRDSQALITGAALAAVIDSNYSLNWKTASGFIHLTAPEIIAVAQAVRAHVQSCFDREGELVALVDAAQTAEELEEIVISWPI